MILFLPLIFAPLLCSQVEIDHDARLLRCMAGATVIASHPGVERMGPRAAFDHVAREVRLFDVDMVSRDDFERGQP